MRSLQMLYLLLLLCINPTKPCKKKTVAVATGIEQCGNSPGFDFATFFQSLTLRVLDLTGIPEVGVTAGWIVFDALSSSGSQDYEFFECIMKSMKTILRGYHYDELNLKLDNIKGDLSILKIYYKPPETPPHEKLDVVLTKLRHGANSLKPVSDVRLSEHVLSLIPIWAALHIDVFKLRMQHDYKKNAVKKEMDIMIIYYSKLILRTWRKVRELKCAKKNLCYQEFGQSPAIILVPGFKVNINTRSNTKKLEAILDSTKVNDLSIISLRATYVSTKIGIHGICRNHWGGGSMMLPAKDWKPSISIQRMVWCVEEKENVHDRWLNCNANGHYNLQGTCSETKLFHSDCNDEKFTIHAVKTGGAQIKSGDDVQIYLNNLWYYPGSHGMGGMSLPTSLSINLELSELSELSEVSEGWEKKEIYDGDIVYFSDAYKLVRFQIFKMNSEMAKDPSDLSAPGL